MDYHNRESRLLSLYTQVWMYQLIGIIILAIARIIFLIKLTSLEKIITYIDCLPLFLWNSWRFDIQVITYTSLLPIVGILFILRCREGVFTRFKRYLRNYYAIVISILIAIVIAEFFFYDNFQSRYNVVFFDFFDEGPLGLLQTMWQDYPVLLILFIIIGVALSICYIGNFISKISIKRYRIKRLTTIFLSIGILSLTFIFIRGSVTQYTLQVEAFMVSPDDNINTSVPNAMYLLKKAYRERSKSFQLYSDEDLLSQYGFSSLDEAIKVAGLSLLEEGSNNEKVEAALLDTIDGTRNTPEDKPNVIIVLNESWSQFLLQMDNENRLDLLCSLRGHLQEDLVFKNIQSVRNGTIYSLETVTLAMPYMKFFNSRYRFQNLKSSIAYPFKNNGYHTAFITGMDPTWENVQEGLAHQFFDEIIGRQDILHSVEESTTSAIGVYDEFLMKYIQDYMDCLSRKGTPFFILALTTTNHPPFTFPENMQLPDLSEEWYKSPYLNGSDEVLRKYGIGFQYANKSFGDFLTEFKKRDIADNTIVLAIGDHNVRSILDYQNVPFQYMYAVPMYMYLPQKYKLTKEFQEKLGQRYGSHYDILPTLASFCFEKGTRYMNIGQDLLDLTRENNEYYSYNEKQLLLPADTKHNLDSIKRMIEARELICKIYCQQQFRLLLDKK